MKEKAANKYSMKDLMLEHRDENIVEQQNELEQANIKEELYSEEYINKLESYNNNLQNLDNLYANIIPLRDVLVRVYLTKPQVNDAGLIIPHKQIVQVPTQNGTATWYEIESDFPYSTKAVVVAVPEHIKSVKPKDVVVLNSNQVSASVTGRGNEAMLKIKSAFLHPDANSTNLPKDPSNQHYGYLLIPEYEIQFKFNS